MTNTRARLLTAGMLLLATLSASCTSWRVQSVTPRELLAREHPSSVRIRETGGAVYVLASPQVQGDSLSGFVKHAPRRISLLMVENVAVRKFNLLKTGFWTLVVPVGGLYGLIGVGCLTAGGCYGSGA